MHKSMTGRPRPVTATVTKPKWMQIPNPDAMAKIRSRSLESNGSTASLTSLLDHDSYNSASDIDDEEPNKKDLQVETIGNTRQNRQSNKEPQKERANSAGKMKQITSSTKTTENRLSAWEQWVIRKAKDDRKKRQEERQKKNQEKAAKEKEEQEKQIKLQKAEIVRQSWLEKKNQETLKKKRKESVEARNVRIVKEEKEKEIQEKASKKFLEWMEMKKKEDNERKERIKEERIQIQQHQERRKQVAEQKFQQWLKQAHNRPKSAPNSFGYLSGKMTGYHDRSAYPQPSFYNPIPWQPTSVPSSKVPDKVKNSRPKSKPYVWNPDKYF